MPPAPQPSPITTDQNDESPDVKAPTNPEKLLDFLVEVVAYLCNLKPEEVVLQDDNDGVMFDSDGSTIWLHINGDSDCVLLTMPMVAELKESEELLRLINLINQDLIYGRVFFQDNTVVFETGYQARWLSRDLLEQEIITIAQLDKNYSPGIHERLGGEMLCTLEPEDEIEV